nr:hypothetical transcript [Hymenolepis microstoma]
MVIRTSISASAVLPRTRSMSAHYAHLRGIGTRQPTREFPTYQEHSYNTDLRSPQEEKSSTLFYAGSLFLPSVANAIGLLSFLGVLALYFWLKHTLPLIK